MGGLLPLVLYLALLQCHAGEGLLKTSSACFGKKEASCAHLNTTCSGQEKVFVVTAQYGSKPCDTCLSEVADSTHCRKNCCRAMARDCFMNYTARDFQTLFLTCKEGDDCVAPSKRNASSCGTVSNFVSVSYVCIKDTNVRQVEVGSSASFSAGAAAAVRFSQGQQRSSSSSGEWRCLVESRPGSSSGGSTELLLVRGPGSSGGGPGAVDRARETTPFYINMSVLQGPETWAVVYTSEGSSLQVTCGSSVTPRPSVTPVTAVTTVTPDTPASSDRSDSSVSSVASNTRETTPRETTPRETSTPEQTNLTVASEVAIAAVVISVIVLLAVAAVLALVLMRRRGLLQKEKSALPVPESTSDPDADHHYTEIVTVYDNNCRAVIPNPGFDREVIAEYDNYLPAIPGPSDLSPRTMPFNVCERGFRLNQIHTAGDWS